MCFYRSLLNNVVLFSTILFISVWVFFRSKNNVVLWLVTHQFKGKSESIMRGGAIQFGLEPIQMLLQGQRHTSHSATVTRSDQTITSIGRPKFTTNNRLTRPKAISWTALKSSYTPNLEQRQLRKLNDLKSSY